MREFLDARKEKKDGGNEKRGDGNMKMRNTLKDSGPSRQHNGEMDPIATELALKNQFDILGERENLTDNKP